MDRSNATKLTALQIRTRLAAAWPMISFDYELDLSRPTVVMVLRGEAKGHTARRRLTEATADYVDRMGRLLAQDLGF